MHVSFDQKAAETPIEDFLNLKVVVQVKLYRRKICDRLKWIKTNYKFIFNPTLYRNAQFIPLVSRNAHLFHSFFITLSSFFYFYTGILDPGMSKKDLRCQSTRNSISVKSFLIVRDISPGDYVTTPTHHSSRRFAKSTGSNHVIPATHVESCSAHTNKSIKQ